jgi:hypothetical protein
MKSVNDGKHDEDKEHEADDPQNARCISGTSKTAATFERLPTGQQLFGLDVHKRVKRPNY